VFRSSAAPHAPFVAAGKEGSKAQTENKKYDAIISLNGSG